MKNIKIIAGDIVIPATLNDTIAAKDFEARLPFKTRGSNSGIDICCTAKEGKFDPSQKQNGWKNGDISLADGWLALLYSGEEQSASYSGMMIIGKIEEQYLSTVASFGSSVDITVEEA
ncbi:MAG: cyclophilin-like fold protein [Eubacteriales bacterium]|nr:cyclophilin-like fold protein [Eubacteriales bacterium]